MMISSEFADVTLVTDDKSKMKCSDAEHCCGTVLLASHVLIFGSFED